MKRFFFPYRQKTASSLKGIKLISSISKQPIQASNKNLLNRETWQGYPVSHPGITVHLTSTAGLSLLAVRVLPSLVANSRYILFQLHVCPSPVRRTMEAQERRGPSSRHGMPLTSFLGSENCHQLLPPKWQWWGGACEPHHSPNFGNGDQRAPK